MTDTLPAALVGLTSANGSGVSASDIESQVKKLQVDPQCYCGKSRDLTKPDFLCSGCYKWFHAACVTYYIGSCVPFMTNYYYTCKNCSPSGLEIFSKKQAGFGQMCFTALANLHVRQPGRSLFSRDKELIPFLEAHWDALTTQPKRTKQTWHLSITKSLTRDDNFTIDETSVANDPQIGLRRLELSKIAPNYEQFKQLTSTLKTAQASEHRGGSNAAGAGAAASSLPLVVAGRGTKKGRPPANAGAAQLQGAATGVGGELALGSRLKRTGDEKEKSRVTPLGFPLEHPFNKDGYRYLLAEPDPHAPGRSSMQDDPSEWLGKPIPGYLYRLYLSPKVLLSMSDRAPQLRLADDQRTLTGEKGYCMNRGTHGVRYGSWYWEVEIRSMPEGSAARIGWSLELGNLQAPVGYDKFSYSFRSRKGTAFHESRGHHYSDTGYAEGDVVGCLIHLPLSEHSATPTPAATAAGSSTTSVIQTPVEAEARSMSALLPASYKD